MAIKILIPFIILSALIFRTSFSVCLAQPKAAARKPAKTQVAGRIAPKTAAQSKKNPAKSADKKVDDPLSHFNQVLENSISGRSPKLEPVAPKPNLTDSLLASLLEKAEAGHQKELSRPVIFLVPRDSAGQASFYRFYKALKAEETGPKSVLVKTFDGAENLALVINGYDNLLVTIKNYPAKSLKTYVFCGIDEIENSKDAYIRFLNVSKSLFKMIAMQNVDFLPTVEEIKPAGAQIEIR